MVSKRSIVAAISLTIIILLILSFLWPLLFQPPIPRQEEYDDVPDWGTGVTVGTDDSFLDNITLDDVPLDLNWSLDPSFTVAVISPVDPPRYWRNTAYDRYMGTNWEKSSNATQLLGSVTPGSEIVYTIVQNITHQVAGSFPLLSLWPDPMIISNSIQCPHLPYPDSYDLETDQYGTAILNARFSNTGNTTLQYQVTYNPLNWTTIRPLAQSASSTPAAILAQYQQQGLNHLSPATRTYIQTELSSILTGVPDNAFEEAFAILNYFKGTFTFDPFVPRPGASDEHVAWFLAQGAGIGLDFATAYTMFLRESGIAARPVVGVVLGTNNSSHRILYLMHVHFWVEVYIPTSGQGYWLQFDPTPLPSFITDGSPPPTPSIKKPPDPSAMDQDPYVISTYYDLSVSVTATVVDRFELFQIIAILTRDGVPEPGEPLLFYDETEHWLIGSNVTTTTGEARTTFQYNNSAIVGFHILRVAFHAQSEYAGIALHGAANLSLSLTPQEVNRTTSVHFNGTLIDAVNGRGISNSETNLTGVSVLLNNILIIEPGTNASGHYSVDYIILASQAPLGLTAVNATFGILGIIDPTNSTIETLNITATSQLSVQAIPNSIRSNSTATIQGQLQYENSTGIAGQSIQLLWNGTPIGSAITDSAGYYALNHTPIPIGYVTIEARFIGVPLVYGSNAVNTALVHKNGTIIIFVDDEDGDNLTQRGGTVYFSGYVEDDNGTRQPSVTVRILINGTEILQTTTLSDGSFSDTYQIDPTHSVGIKEVTGDIIDGTLVVVSSFDYFILNSTTQIQNLSFDMTPAMLGESVTLTGQIIDDQDIGLSGQPLSVSLSYLTTTIPLGTTFSQPDGSFSYSFVIPVSIPGSISTVSFDISYLGTPFLGLNSSSEPLDVFSNATLLIDVSSGPFAWNASIPINGTLVDSFGRALTNRDIQLFIDNTYNFTAQSNQFGQVYFVLRLRPSGNTDVNYTLQLRHETIITVNSTVRIITVEAQEQMQTPPPLYFPIEWIIAIIVVLVIIVVAILGYRYWKRRPRQPTAPSIDAAAMLTALRQLLTQQKYRESIIYAFRMFETIVQAKLGIYRDPSITVREFANLTVAHGRLDTRNMEVFIRGVEEARYSDHPISYNTALSTLNAFAKMYNSLTGGNLRFVTQEQQPATEPERTESS